MTDMNPTPQPGGDSPQGEGSEITVCIEFNPATGEYSVGLEPPEGDATAQPGDEESAEQDYMKPAKSLDDALAQAKQLLSTPQDATGAGNPFEDGFKAVRGSEPPTGQYSTSPGGM